MLSVPKSVRQLLPRLSRVHFLLLGDDASRGIVQSTIDTYDWWGEHGRSSDEISEALVSLLAQEINIHDDGELVVELNQAISENFRCHIVIDMETTDNNKTTKGIITSETSIYTEGPPLEPLKYLKLYLLRPFSRSSIPVVPETTSSQRRNITSTSASSSTSSLNDFSTCKNSSDPRTDSPDSVNVRIVYMDQLLKYALEKNPYITFIKGRQIYLPCPPELVPFIRRNPWASEWNVTSTTSLSEQTEQQETQQQQLRSSSFSNHETEISHNAREQESSLHDSIYSMPEILRYCNNFREMTSSSSSNNPLNSRTKYLRFLVVGTGDLPIGVFISNKTELSIQLDPIGEYERIQISPVFETIPRSYEFDFFSSYVRPFLQRSPLHIFHKDELITYHAVQFKIQRTLPALVSEIDIPDWHSIYWRSSAGKLNLEGHTLAVSPLPARTVIKWDQYNERYKRRLKFRRGALCCRVGQSTRIHEGQPVNLHWLDLLPQADVDDIRAMPTRLQPFALLHAIRELSQVDIARLMGWRLEEEDYVFEDLEAQSRIKEKIALDIVAEFSKTFKGQSYGGSSHLCIVCLESLEPGVSVLELPCNHIFHEKCVEEWLKRSLLCPVCKRDISTFFQKPTAHSGSLQF